MASSSVEPVLGQSTQEEVATRCPWRASS